MACSASLCRPSARPALALRSQARSQRAVTARKPVLSVRCSATTAAEELPKSLQSLVQSFQSVQDPMARYKQLLFYATKLQPLAAEAHTEENKVKGCVSQVWVSAELEGGKVIWRADSDSQLTKGLAALLVQGLSGLTPDEIVRVPADFITQLGLHQSLTPSRNNGFLNMFKLMQKKALDMYMQQAAGSDDESPSAASPAAQAGLAEVPADAAQAAAPPAVSSSSSSSSSSSEAANGGASEGGVESNTPVADSMRRRLGAELAPLVLDIIDNSRQHAGHGGYRGNVSYSGETHFTIEVVSPRFEGLTSIKRHRLVYGILEEEMRNPVHALSLITKTPAEAGMA